MDTCWWIGHNWKSISTLAPDWVVKERGIDPSTGAARMSMQHFDAYMCSNCDKVKLIFRDGDTYKYDL